MLLLGRFGDDLDPLGEEGAHIVAVGEEHLAGQLEVLPLVRVGDKECLRCTVVLRADGVGGGGRGRWRVREVEGKGGVG